jgi:hypothetical protein
VQKDSQYGIWVDEAQYFEMANKYSRSMSPSDPNYTIGGVIGKENIQRLVNSIHTDSQYVSFRFGYHFVPSTTHPGRIDRKTVLLMKGGNKEDEHGAVYEYLRNDRWCPAACGN